MRICLLTSGHNPDDDRIYYKEARSLIKKYSDVWIISPFPQRIPKVEDKVKFHSIPFSCSWIQRYRNLKEIYKVALKLKADVYHCHEPESLIVAIDLKKKLGCKVVFDSHEMYSASLASRFPAYLHNKVMSAYKLYESLKVRQCDYMLGASWAIAEYFKSFMGSHRIETILNCPLPDIFGEVPAREWGEETVVCHEGHLPFARGLKMMVKAIEIVNRKYPVRFKIIGDVFGEERRWLESYVAEHKLENIIERTGWLDYRDVGTALASCHIGLIAMQKLPNNIVTSANKEFNYMYYGIPFVSPNFRLSTNKLIAEEKCGLSANSVSAESYAEAISYMIENRKETIQMGLNAKRASQEKYLWNHMEMKLFKVYEQIEK
jgi:glycosyltransferase involved in cell wall biosynthesis